MPGIPAVSASAAMAPAPSAEIVSPQRQFLREWPLSPRPTISANSASFKGLARQGMNRAEKRATTRSRRVPSAVFLSDLTVLALRLLSSPRTTYSGPRERHEAAQDGGPIPPPQDAPGQGMAQPASVRTAGGSRAPGGGAAPPAGRAHGTGGRVHCRGRGPHPGRAATRPAGDTPGAGSPLTTA